MCRSNAWMVCMAVVWMLASCGNRSGKALLPSSSGRPYEVLLVGNEPQLRTLVRSTLTTEIQGLPQSEPAFDISTIATEQLNTQNRQARNIVIIVIDRKSGGHLRLTHQRDVYASPQVIVRLTAPDVATFRREWPQTAPRLTALLERAELMAALRHLKRQSNAEANRRIEEVMHCQLLVPSDLTAWKQGKHFLWFSDNGNDGMRNLCLYMLPLGTDILHGRDSIMQANIPGEEPHMRMTTVNSTVNKWRIKGKNGERIIVRGLWEMEHDAMGGPFVLHVMTDSIRHRLLVAEAFVYAPAGKKRNKVKELEAALYTLYCRQDAKGR